jgi:hypothetical protein
MDVLGLPLTLSEILASLMTRNKAFIIGLAIAKRCQIS